MITQSLHLLHESQLAERWTCNVKMSHYWQKGDRCSTLSHYWQKGDRLFRYWNRRRLGDMWSQPTHFHCTVAPNKCMNFSTYRLNCNRTSLSTTYHDTHSFFKCLCSFCLVENQTFTKVKILNAHRLCNRLPFTWFTCIYGSYCLSYIMLLYICDVVYSYLMFSQCDTFARRIDCVMWYLVAWCVTLCDSFLLHM